MLQQLFLIIYLSGSPVSTIPYDNINECLKFANKAQEDHYANQWKSGVSIEYKCEYRFKIFGYIL